MIQVRNIDRVLVLGDSESGKTWLAKTMIQAIPQNQLVVITPYPDEFTNVQNRLVTVFPEKALELIIAVLKDGNRFLVIDDFDILFERDMSAGERALKILLVSGRHASIGWLIIARRTTDIPKLMVKQATLLFFFQTNLGLDLQIIQEMFGAQAAYTVQSLNWQNHECLFLDRRSRESRVIIV